MVGAQAAHGNLRRERRSGVAAKTQENLVFITQYTNYFAQILIQFYVCVYALSPMPKSLHLLR